MHSIFFGGWSEFLLSDKVVRTSTCGRIRCGRNDTIFERLDVTFTFEQAQQQSVAIKGANVTHEAVRQMLKNWKRQGLINILPDSRYQKVASTVLNPVISGH